MDPDAIRTRFEENRRKFREDQVERAWAQMSGGAASISVADFGAVCFQIDSSMDAAAVQDAVREIDTDGDGCIELREFRPWYMARLAAKDAEARNRREMGFGDDGEWDELEMQRRVRKHMDSMEAARIKRTFDAMDEDGSGEIERDEFHRLVRRLSPQRSPEWINNQFDLADDGSGSLDFEEFKVWWDSPEIKEMRGEEQREARERAKLQKLEEDVAQQHAARARRREQFEEETGAATKLQRVLRGRQGRAKARQAKAQRDNRQTIAITKLQCAVRGRIARRQRTFAAIAIAAKAELQAKEDVSKLFWGDGDDAAEREAHLWRDFQRLQASASAAVQQYTWEEWRWRWLEMRSGGWLERLQPSIQAEHCRRLATAAVLAEEESQIQERLAAEAHKAARAKLQSQFQPACSPSTPQAERHNSQQEADFSDAPGNTSSLAKAQTPVAASPVHPRVPGTGSKKTGMRMRPISGGTTLANRNPQMCTTSGQICTSPNHVGEASESSMAATQWPEWYRATRNLHLLGEHRSLLGDSVVHGSRMKRRADNLMQGLHLRPASSAGCFLLPERAEIALAMLQAADEPTAPPCPTLRLSGSHRVPFGERPIYTDSSSQNGSTDTGPPNDVRCGHSSFSARRPTSRVKNTSNSSTVVQLGTSDASKARLVHDDTAASMGDSEYEKTFGIDPWSEHSGSVDHDSAHGQAESVFAAQRRQRQSLSPRPVTAGSSIREGASKRMQNDPQWIRAADSVLDKTVEHSLKHSVASPLASTTSRCRPKSVHGGSRRTQLDRDSIAAVPRPSTVAGKRIQHSAAKVCSDAQQGRLGTRRTRRRRQQRPVRGLTGWQQGQSKGVSSVVGAGRSVVYDIAF